MAAEKKVRRKRKRRSVLYKPIAVILIFAVILFGVSMFFRITHIQVEGNQIYSEDEIIQSAGISVGDNLFFINKSEAAAKINKGLVYIDEVKILRRLPGTIVLQVTESRTIAAISDGSSYWLINKKGKALEQIGASGKENAITVSGFTADAPQVGVKISVAEEDGAKLTYLTSLLDAIEGAGIENDITSIDMSGISNISFQYLSRFTVRLGSGENLEYKLQLLGTVMQQLAENDTGTIDLSTDKEAHFTPK